MAKSLSGEVAVETGKETDTLFNEHGNISPHACMEDPINSSFNMIFFLSKEYVCFSLLNLVVWKPYKYAKHVQTY